MIHARAFATVFACTALLAAAGITQAQTVTPRASYDTCRSEAVGRGLVGEQRADYVDECLKRPATVGTAPMSGATGKTFGECRRDAIAQGYGKGDALNKFLDDCVGK